MSVTETRYLGGPKLAVPAIGLGCWGMSDAYGPADRAESIATLREALDSGLNFFDTADVYGAGHNELLLAEALQGRRRHAVIASKFGFRGNEHGALEICGRASYVREACHASLKRLGTDYLDLYFLHRVDKTIPIEETVATMSALVQEGKVRHIGLSEASAATLRRAHAVHPVTALQSEYSLVTREVEQEILPLCRELGIGFVAFSPLGRGLLGAIRHRNELTENDYRRNLPRFQSGQFEKNLGLTNRLDEIAQQRNVRPIQVALAWVLQQSPDLIAIPGMKTRAHLRQNIEAAALRLSPPECASLQELAGQIQGERHNADNLRFLDT